MEISKRQLLLMQQAIGYAVMYAKTEHETAEFALLKLDIDGMLIRMKAAEHRQRNHENKGCPFNYCDSTPECEGKCRYASTTD